MSRINTVAVRPLLNEYEVKRALKWGEVRAEEGNQANRSLHASDSGGRGNSRWLVSVIASYGKGGRGYGNKVVMNGSGYY